MFKLLHRLIYGPIQVRYHDDTYTLKKEEKGDWVDLAVCKVAINGVMQPDGLSMYPYKAGDLVEIYLGVSMKLPRRHSGYILPRGSTFEKTGLLLTNSMGVVDNTYHGDTDEWKAKMWATRDGVIYYGQRVVQFSISKIAPFNLATVDRLTGASRGGYGSTGR